jgi:hypothetical protein
VAIASSTQLGFRPLRTRNGRRVENEILPNGSARVPYLRNELKIEQAVVNGGMVKAYRFQFFPAVKMRIFREFAEKNAIQKVR